MSAIQKVQN